MLGRFLTVILFGVLVNAQALRLNPNSTQFAERLGK
jgi:hypothetical protein